VTLGGLWDAGIGLLVVYLAIVVVFWRLSDVFLTKNNFLNIGVSVSILGIVAATQTMVIIGRGFDLSVGSTVAIAGVVTAEILSAGGSGSLAVAGAIGVVGWLGRRHTAALGLATGMLYGVADAATKAGAALLHRGVVPTLLSPWPPMFVISCAAAFFLFQRGLQRGPAMTVVAVMSGALNVTAVAAGLAMFGETLGTTTAVACLHAVALTAVLVATWWLARAQARAATGAERQGEVRVGARGLE
jgi:ribose/xylose/arabinose/galactoside ABC-type transport system permease subunit